MQLLRELEELGYEVAFEGNNIRLTWRGQGKPDPATVKPLLDELKRRKEEAIRWLAPRQPEPDYKAEAEKAQELLREQGWCVVWSRVLGEPVVWVRDGKVAIPERWKDAVKYHLRELEALTRPPKPGPEELRKLHQAKRLFGGEIGAGDPE